jgi:hypothetical protein
VVADAQTQAPPQTLFQYATVTGAGNTMTATRVPVTTHTGKTIYKNVTVRFDVDEDGNLALAADHPQVVDAPDLLVSSFKAGSYVGPGTILAGKTPAFVDGPGALPGGASSWSFSSAPGADSCAYPSSATWYVGPITSNPLAARLAKANITSTAWSYGVASGPYDEDRCTNGAFFRNQNWPAGTLVGVSQSGNAITFASFSHTSCKGCSYYDSSAPGDQITYRIAP